MTLDDLNAVMADRLSISKAPYRVFETTVAQLIGADPDWVIDAPLWEVVWRTSPVLRAMPTGDWVALLTAACAMEGHPR